jgi:hypothetical protein
MDFSDMNDNVRRELERVFYDYLPVHLLLTPTQVEEIYGLKKDTIRKWYARGHIRGFRIVEGLKFRRIDVERLIRQRMPHLLERFKGRLDQSELIS